MIQHIKIKQVFFKNNFEKINYYIDEEIMNKIRQ